MGSGFRRQKSLITGADKISSEPANSSVTTQFLRFAVVGLVSNLLLFLAYLGLTGGGMGHKTAMSVLYVTGVCLSFYFNKTWTFSHGGQYRRTFAGYIAVYLLGYLVNLFALYVFVDLWGFKHEMVQGVMILVIATLMFILQKYILFSAHKPGDHAEK